MRRTVATVGGALVGAVSILGSLLTPRTADAQGRTHDCPAGTPHDAEGWCILPAPPARPPPPVPAPPRPPRRPTHTCGDYSPESLPLCKADCGTEMVNHVDKSSRLPSCVVLGRMYLTGEGAPKDEAQATSLFKKICEMGEPDACENLRNLGDSYSSGSGGVAKDAAHAAALFQLACDGGNLPACTNLGIMYDHGEGVEQDVPRAMKLYQRACDGGEGYGCFDLGVRYKGGKGVARDRALAMRFYQMACDKKVPDACDSLDSLKAQAEAPASAPAPSSAEPAAPVPARAYTPTSTPSHYTSDADESKPVAGLVLMSLTADYAHYTQPGQSGVNAVGGGLRIQGGGAIAGPLLVGLDLGMSGMGGGERAGYDFHLGATTGLAASWIALLIAAGGGADSINLGLDPAWYGYVRGDLLLRIVPHSFEMIAGAGYAGRSKESTEEDVHGSLWICFSPAKEDKDDDCGKLVLGGAYVDYPGVSTTGFVVTAGIGLNAVFLK